APGVGDRGGGGKGERPLFPAIKISSCIDIFTGKPRRTLAAGVPGRNLGDGRGSAGPVPHSPFPVPHPPLPGASSMDFTAILIQLVSGAVGGNVGGMLNKAKSLGPMLNSVLGGVGGVAGGQL